MKRTFYIIISWLIFIIIAGIMFWSINQINKVSYKPAKNAEIPHETKDYFADLLGKFSFNITFIESLDDSVWSNDGDYGMDSISGMAKLEDDNFIIYFDANSAEELKKGQLILSHANQNIKPLTLMFARYRYPVDENGRKLPVYLASNEEKFYDLYVILSRVETDTDWMAGVCINTASSNGEFMTNGIILKDFDECGQEVQLINNLKHEMAHYVHLNNVNWLSTHPMIWETEGFAMYFEQDKDYFIAIGPSIRQSVERINLATDVKNYLDAYWVGYSVMQFIADKYGPSKAEEYIQTSYTLPSIMNFNKSTQTSIEAFELSWQKYVNQKF